jgi:hypothetical protein
VTQSVYADADAAAEGSLEADAKGKAGDNRPRKGCTDRKRPVLPPTLCSRYSSDSVASDSVSEVSAPAESAGGTDPLTETAGGREAAPATLGGAEAEAEAPGSVEAEAEAYESADARERADADVVRRAQ